MVEEAVRHSHGKGQPEHRVGNAEGIDTAVPPEHLAEKQPANQGERRQDGAGQMSGGKQRRRDPNGGGTPEQLFATRERKRLTHEIPETRPHPELPPEAEARPPPPPK